MILQTAKQAVKCSLFMCPGNRGQVIDGQLTLSATSNIFKGKIKVLPNWKQTLCAVITED